jgi:hypothetical protein
VRTLQRKRQPRMCKTQKSWFRFPMRRKTLLCKTSTQPPNQQVSDVDSLGVKGPVCEANHSPTPNDENKYLWSLTSIPPYASTECTLTVVSLLHHKSGTDQAAAAKLWYLLQTSFQLPASFRVYPGDRWDATFRWVTVIWFKILTCSKSIFMFSN